VATTALLHLLQFASPALPIGAYSYSQGLEAALAAGDAAALSCWAERYLASRDTAELRAESVQMGFSLGRLLAELELAPATAAEEALPAALARAVHALGIRHEDALLAMLFGWAENQVLVCVKSIPLGQAAGQRLLLSLRPDIEAAAHTAQVLADGELSNWAPGLSLLSMRHEVQHGRLYRS
jgi:urease accessory protein